MLFRWNLPEQPLSATHSLFLSLSSILIGCITPNAIELLVDHVRSIQLSTKQQLFQISYLSRLLLVNIVNCLMHSSESNVFMIDILVEEFFLFPVAFIGTIQMSIISFMNLVELPRISPWIKFNLSVSFLCNSQIASSQLGHLLIQIAQIFFHT